VAKLNPGDRINNYLLLEQVGRGTFGEVWKARHHVWADQLVAVKVPTDEQYVRNLQKEGMVVHGLAHPNIVRVIDLDPFADVPYMIMEFVDGRSLRELLAERKRLDAEAAADFLRQILSGLQAAHDAGIVHRDVKPANILIDKSGVAKVADFGLGRVAAVTTQSLLISGSLQTFEGKSISGTLAYMAPEQQEGAGDSGPPADLYAAGIVFFEMLTGARPHGMDAPSDLVPELPQWVDGVFRRAYTRLERRYRTAGEMLAALEEARRPKPPPIPKTPSVGDTADEHKVGGNGDSDPDILILTDDGDSPPETGRDRDRAAAAFGRRPSLEKERPGRGNRSGSGDVTWLDEGDSGSAEAAADNARDSARDARGRGSYREPVRTPPVSPGPNPNLPRGRLPTSLPHSHTPSRTDSWTGLVRPPVSAPTRAAVGRTAPSAGSAVGGPAVGGTTAGAGDPLAAGLGTGAGAGAAGPGASPVVATRPCPSCATPLAESDNFCLRCGRQAVAAVRRCDHCGAYPAPEDVFCTWCGQEIGVMTIR
jgi:serine/threonine protein kinase